MIKVSKESILKLLDNKLDINEKNTILKLYNGELNPAELEFIGDSKYRTNYIKADELDLKITNLLPKKYKKLMSEYALIKDICSSYICDLTFVNGFSLGVKLTVESLINVDTTE